MTHLEVGEEVMNKFISMVSEISTIEKKPSMDGRWLVAILAPKKK
jgi:translation initiation factor IF-3